MIVRSIDQNGRAEPLNHATDGDRILDAARNILARHHGHVTGGDPVPLPSAEPIRLSGRPPDVGENNIARLLTR